MCNSLVRIMGLPGPGRPGAQWVDEWDAGEQDVLPQAVEVELRFVLPSEERRVFTTMISVARAPE